jgi:hypothetical protein
MDKKYLKDMAERALMTALQAGIASYIVVGKDGWKTAALAAVAAGLSVVKSAIAKKIGDPESASVVPSV